MSVIYTANWVLPVTAPPLERGAVLIEGEVISDVGTIAGVSARHPEVRIVDLGRSILLPGLINVHSHLELTVFRGRLEESRFQGWIRRLIEMKAGFLTSADLLTSSRLGCCEAIRSGITTTADTSDASGPLDALIESGLRGMVFQETFGPDPAQAGAAIDDLARKLDLHSAKLATAGARLRIGVSPHAPYSVSAELYRRTSRLALNRGLDVAIHTAESLDEELLLRDGSGAFGESLSRRGIPFEPPGCSTISYFERLGVLETSPLLIHCVRVDESDIELMAGSKVAHCPKSNAKFGHGIAPLSLFNQAGLTVGLGTDSVASNNGCDLIEEARFGALLHRAFDGNAETCPPTRMIEMMTIDGARALGLADITGSIEKGKQADLTAVRCDQSHNSPVYDPTTALVFSCSGRDVSMTMVAGRILYDGSQVLTIDEAGLRQQVEAIRRKLAA